MLGKWIISDLDGTLLDSRQRISPAVKQRIRLFQTQGGVFTLATGRSLSSALPFIEELGIRAPVILYNGAKLYDPIGKMFVKEHALPPAAYRHALQSFERIGRSLGLDLLVYSRENIYAPSVTEAVERYRQKDKVDIAWSPMPELYDRFEETTKIMFLGDPAKLMSFQERCFPPAGQPEEEPLWHAVRSEPDYLEILPPRVNKGSACLELIELLGLDIADLTAVGDNLNDREMIALVPNGVAVRNAHPALKEAADWITAGTNNEDAILEVLGR